MPYPFARRAAQLEMSGIRRIFELARGMTDAIDLSLGQPDFEPPPAVREAAKRAVDGGRNRYTVTQGIPPLRELLAAKLGVDPAGVMITAGATGGLFLAISAFVDEGDGVLMADPYFVAYHRLTTIAGGTPQLVDTYPDFRLTPERLERAVTPRSKMLIVNSPANPTGVAYRREEMAALAAFASRRGLILVSDEIYDAYAFDRPHEPMRPHHPHTVTIGGFSKTYGVPGWRLGWCAGPPAIVERMIALQQVTYVNPNSTAQEAALAMLDTDMTPWIGPYRAKRDRIFDGLRDRFEMTRPEGAFYLFPKAPGGDGTAFVERAIAAKVLTIPGTAFSSRATHFRISFAVSDAVLERGIEALRKLA